MRISARWLGAILVAVSFAADAQAGAPISIEERIAARRAVEEVYWRHRIWPAENPGRKPPLDDVLPVETIRAQVEDGLRKSAALKAFWGRPIGHHELQAEIDRIGRNTKSPAMLAEIMEALGNDAALFAEVVARPTLADRLVRRWHAASDDASFESWWEGARAALPVTMVPIEGETFDFPVLRAADCTADTWQSIASDPPDPAVSPIAVWTGSEMLVWGGAGAAHGARYDPATDKWTRIPHAGGPGSRDGAAGVWTGSVLIVWGGGNLNTGAQFDPATNAWTPLPMSGSVPSGRSGHTAVWTGTQMLVWGGQVNTGGRYTPSTGTWQAMALGPNVPSARTGHTAVWTGSQMLVWGGYQFGSNTHFNDGGRYDPASDTWLPLAPPVLTARRYHTAVWTGARMVVHGGANQFGVATGGGMYDPVTNSWVETSTAPAAPACAQAGAVWSGSRMLVWGCSSVGGSFNPVTNSWTLMSTTGAPIPRTRLGAVWTGSEMLVWGGNQSDSMALRTGGRYSPTTDTWLPISVGGEDFPSARFDSGSVWTGAEAIIVGGMESFYFKVGGAFRYDPTLDAWSSFPGGVTGDLSRRAVWTGVVVFAGGSPAARFDPQASIWRTVSDSGAPSARFMNTAVWTGTHVIVWGGRGSANGLDSGGRYDPRSDTWSATSTAGAPSPRADHVAVWTGSRMLVWAGQAANGSALNTGGLYDPVTDTWSATSTVNAPSARWVPEGVWTGSRFLAWGGGLGTNTGGLYDPVNNTWSPTSLGAGLPEFRYQHSLVWTGTFALVWGGRRDFNNLSYHDNGARYLPSTNSWTSVSMTGAPPPRADHVAVRMDRQVLIWGGQPINANGALYCLGACSPSPWYRDADLDGYGTETDVLQACDPPAGYVRSRGDCNDASAAVRPFATEICNGIDDDCDTLTDEAPDLDGDGFACAADCNDADATVYPGAPEICDYKNNNCDDPSWPAIPASDGVDADADGFRLCNFECDDANSTVYPFAPQLCDGINNDCFDGTWPTPPPNEADADGDGVRGCQGDCNDANPNVYPSRAEVCNAIDDDCDARVDEGAGEIVDADSDGVRGACDNCPQAVNANQLDADADGHGDACDNCLTTVNSGQQNADADPRGDACDNCALDFNPSQSDFDADLQGDRCDLDDSLIYVFRVDRGYVEWQAEAGYDAWNVYEGDLDVLRLSGSYTQAVGSNPIAERACGIADPWVEDFGWLDHGKVKFALVAGVSSGIPSGLGSSSAGVPRANTSPCP